MIIEIFTGICEIVGIVAISKFLAGKVKFNE